MNERTVLIVDDDPGIRQLLSFVLQGRGYVVSVAVDGLEGLEKARGTHPRLIITDVRMPNMDGVAMVKAIHQDFPAQRMIVMTGYAAEEQLDGIRTAGIPLIEKPFAMDTLLPMVQEALGDP